MKLRPWGRVTVKQHIIYSSYNNYKSKADSSNKIHSNIHNNFNIASHSYKNKRENENKSELCSLLGRGQAVHTIVEHTLKSPVSHT